MFVSTCAGAELPEPANRTPAAALVRIRRRPLVVVVDVVVAQLLLLPPMLPLPLLLLLLALLPLLCLASDGPRRE